MFGAMSCPVLVRACWGWGPAYFWAGCQVSEANERILAYNTVDALIAGLTARVKATHRVVFLVDAPTSRVRIIASLLDEVAKIIPLLPTRGPPFRCPVLLAFAQPARKPFLSLCSRRT